MYMDLFNSYARTPPWFTNDKNNYKMIHNLAAIDYIIDSEHIGIDNNEIKKVCKCLRGNDPHFFNKVSINDGQYTSFVQIRPESQYDTYIELIQKKIKDLYRELEIANCSSNLEIEYKVHDWICNNSEYSMDYDGTGKAWDLFTIPGILLNNKGVCSSFSKVTTLLLNSFGVECYTVTGDVKDKDKTNYGKLHRFLEEELNQNRLEEKYNPCNNKIPPILPSIDGHAWNLVKINKDEWYFLDVTWDCSDNGPKYKYFNVYYEDLIEEGRKFDDQEFFDKWKYGHRPQ